MTATPMLRSDNLPDEMIVNPLPASLYHDWEVSFSLDGEVYRYFRRSRVWHNWTSTEIVRFALDPDSDDNQMTFAEGVETGLIVIALESAVAAYEAVSKVYSVLSWRTNAMHITQGDYDGNP